MGIELAAGEVKVLQNAVWLNLKMMSAVEANATIRAWAGFKKLADDIVSAAVLDGDVVDMESHNEAVCRETARANDAEAARDEFLADVERLHRLICEQDRQGALDLLRSMVPDHSFLSDAAGLMLAGFQRGAAQ